MLPRSSSTSSCIQSFNENISLTTNLHHYESLQNLQQIQREKSLHPLTVDNNHLNLPIIPHPKKEIIIIKETLPINEKKNEQQADKLRRTIVQDDIENIQERLNGMLIAVPSTNENEKHLLVQQPSTNEYFTPKISIEENDDDDDLDRNSTSSSSSDSPLLIFIFQTLPKELNLTHIHFSMC
jgi:hypothetical protein